MGQPPFYRSIQFKLLMAMAGLLLFFTVTIGLFRIRDLEKIDQEILTSQSTRYRDFYLNQFAAWTHAIKYNVEYNVGRPGFGTSPSRLQNLVSNNAYITHAAVTESNGTIHLYIQKSGLSTHIHPTTDDLRKAHWTNATSFTCGEGTNRVIEFVEPVFAEGRFWGVFRVGLLTEPLQDLNDRLAKELHHIRRAAFRRDAIILIIILCVSMLIIAFLSSRLTKPIMRLTEAARRIAGGDYRAGQELEITANDETGILGDSFRNMAGQVEQSNSNQRQMIEKAHQTETFLQSILENIPDMVFIKDAEGLRFIYINSAGEKLLGFPQEAFIGKTDYDFFPPEQANFFISRDRDTLNRGGWSTSSRSRSGPVTDSFDTCIRKKFPWVMKPAVHSISLAYHATLPKLKTPGMINSTSSPRLPTCSASSDLMVTFSNSIPRIYSIWDTARRKCSAVRSLTSSIPMTGMRWKSP